MFYKFRLISIFLVSTCFVFGESRIEIIEYLKNELESCKSEKYEIKDINITKDGKTLRMTNSRPGSFFGNRFEMSIPDTEIYSNREILKIGNDKYVSTYNLYAISRNKSNGLRLNMDTIPGPVILVQNSINKNKIENIERTFNRLKRIVSKGEIVSNEN